jgi:uncharacterized protein (TIGR02246 family)
MNSEHEPGKGNPNEISAALSDWAQAIRSRSPERVLTLYADTAVLVGTLSDVIRQGYDPVMEYFVNFCALDKLDVEVVSKNIRMFDDMAISTGIYNFSWNVASDKVFVRVRFTFVYRREDDKWLIIEHHSSLQPDLPFDPSPYFIRNR